MASTSKGLPPVRAINTKSMDSFKQTYRKTKSRIAASIDGKGKDSHLTHTNFRCEATTGKITSPAPAKC